MKKRLLALAMAAALALVVVPLALAVGNDDSNAANPPAKGKPFLAKGTVVSVSVETTSMVVLVTKGSHNMKSLISEEVTFTLAPRCHIFARTVGHHHGKVHFKHATLDQVTVGSWVNINGRVDRRVQDAPVYWARHIVVKLAPAPSQTPPASPSVASAR
jgi:hypothetical protein